MGAGRMQAILISLYVVLSIFPLMNIRSAEFPVLIQFVNPFEEPLAPFFLRQVEEYFNDPRSIAMKMASPSPQWTDTVPSRCFSRRTTLPAAPACEESPDAPEPPVLPHNRND